MSEKVPISGKAHLLSLCFVTSNTFQSFHYGELNIHTYLYTCIYITIYKCTHICEWVYMFVFFPVETFGMIQYIHDITL